MKLKIEAKLLKSNDLLLANANGNMRLGQCIILMMAMPPPMSMTQNIQYKGKQQIEIRVQTTT
jgi:hypothetical protein